MSDPVNACLAAGQKRLQQAYDYAQPAYGQQQVYGHAQPAYGQQQAYGHAQPAYGQSVYVLNPEIERTRSNASTARMLSFMNFLFGHLLPVGDMWFWINKLIEEAKTLGTPMDVMTGVENARSAVKICPIIQIAIAAAVFLFLILMVIIGATATANSRHIVTCGAQGSGEFPRTPTHSG